MPRTHSFILFTAVSVFLATAFSGHAVETPPPKPTTTPSGSATPTPAPVVTSTIPTPTRFSADVESIISALESGVPLTSAQRQILAGLSQTILQDINARLFRLRAGVTLRDDGTLGAGGPNGNGKEAKGPPEAPFHHWDIFTSGDYGNFDLNDEGSHPGFESNTWVGTLGAEYRVNEHYAFGLAGSWVSSGADLSQKIGHINTDGIVISAYGSAVWENFYADLLYSFGTLEQRTRRNTFTGHTARGDTNAITNAIQFNTGYILKFGGFHTGPIASLNWVHGDVDGFNESGGGNANLSFPTGHVDSLISQVGWTASYVAHTGFALVIPQVRATWDHEYLESSNEVSATLLQTPFSSVTGTGVNHFGKYTATGRAAQPGSDYLNLGAGISARFNERCGVTLDYQTHLFQQRTSAQFASIKLDYAF
ncbi:MAG: autotransporter outer membrane beta-barrel domain-containing protein [Chthoniobacter sp.]|uniref:autotransporter outer membrane beta-barrel domain-containing protein n=1 Tax=Chthoniobacter sp. TaxID=2510640 RepID=UPI0032A4CBFA